MKEQKVFTLQKSRKKEYFLATIFGAIVLKEIIDRTLNPLVFGISCLFVLICISMAWPLWLKEYRIQIDGNTITFSEWTVEKGLVTIPLNSIREICKQIIWSHPYGIGAQVRFKFTLNTGRVIYLSKNFGPEFQNELIKVSTTHKIDLVL